jgi:glycosyltransferase involved in cell wall biosynthesis/2-polyprenyl-3-methyl-5-hydroxy-6-metoxy-1,4-benzoquinol methylase
MPELITIVVASYNYEKFLPQTLDSLIAQSHRNWEAIVVDDGSKDSSVAVIRDYALRDSRIRLKQHPGSINRGLGASVQLAINCAMGAWIAFCESDDWWNPLFLETSLKRFHDEPTAGVVFSDVILEGKSPSMESHCELVRNHFRKGGAAIELYREMYNAVPTFSCAMVKSELIRSCDFNAHFAPSLDMWLWAQLINKTRFAFIDQPLAHWRQHDLSYMKKSIEPGSLEMETVLEFQRQMRHLFEQKLDCGFATVNSDRQLKVSELELNLPGLFDLNFYRSSYPDLQGMSDSQLVEHYQNHGYSEGRVAADATMLQISNEEVLIKNMAIGVVGLSMVKNEEDIIEKFVRHNLQFVESLVILDNGSIDGTREILRSLQREGLPLLILDDPVTSYIQEQKMTQLLQWICSSFFPEFVVPLDADEFISCKPGVDFAERLREIQPGGSGLVPWHTYVVTPNSDEHYFADIPRSYTARRAVEKPQYFKTIVRTCGRAFPDVVFSQGSHFATSRDGKPLPSIELPGIALAHYPVRGCEQVATKGVITAMAQLERNPESEKEGVCYQHFLIKNRVLGNEGLTDSDLPELSFQYAQSRSMPDWSLDVIDDPISYKYTCHYNNGSRLSLLAKVVKSWEFSLLKGRSVGAEIRRLVENQRRLLSMEFESGEGTVLPTSFDPLWHYEHLFVDVAPFQFLADRYEIKSAIDVGGGIGANLEILRSLGVSEVVGLDEFPDEFALLAESEYVQHDLTKPFSLGKTFDLVICTEVAEHLIPGSEMDLIRSLAQHAKDLILFSAAEPGQPGHGHINCKSIGYWLSCWRQIGWEPVLFDTLAFRCAATMSWLRRNPVVLRPMSPESSGTDDVRVELESIGSRSYSWYSQDPEIRSFALHEAIPDSYTTSNR